MRFIRSHTQRKKYKTKKQIGKEKEKLDFQITFVKMSQQDNDSTSTRGMCCVELTDINAKANIMPLNVPCNTNNNTSCQSQSHFEYSVSFPVAVNLPQFQVSATGMKGRRVLA